MTARDSGRDEAERWFLTRGLPTALTARGRTRHLVARSAPALAAYATVALALLAVFLLTGSSEIYIDGAPTPAEQLVLAVLTLTVPLATAVGVVVSRLRNLRTKTAIATGAVAIAAISSVIQGGPSHLLAVAIVVAVVAAMTVTGAGAVLAWAVQLTMNQVAAMGELFVRSLPVLLLTVVVFFNGYVWLMATTISRTRLWLAVLFLLAVTVVFLVSTSASRVRPMLESASAAAEDTHDLSGTPFAAIPDPPVSAPLTRAERLNVVGVFAAAQVAHLLMVAICTATIYFALGLIVLSPALLAKWTGGGSSDGTVFGMTIPVPQSLIHMTMVLCALTFMYVSARSVGDDEYKQDFLVPLITDLHTTLIARNRYRSAQPAGG